jgi:hypothetical protein
MDKAAAQRRLILARIFKCGFRTARAIRPTGAADRISHPTNRTPQPSLRDGTPLVPPVTRI